MCILVGISVTRPKFMFCFIYFFCFCVVFYVVAFYTGGDVKICDLMSSTHVIRIQSYVKNKKKDK